MTSRPLPAIPAGVRPAASGGGTLIPPADFFGALPGPYVWDPQSARRVPSVARAIQLYAGLCKQMPIDAYRGTTPLPRPRMLSRPDPYRARSWFVQVTIEDYLLNGNAIALITSRGADGWPMSVTWLPASYVYISWDQTNEQDVAYWYLGSPLKFDDVVHIRRGADRYYPVRGVGVVEEFLATLDRVAMEEAYERNTLSGSSVPSVAVITPQAMLSKEVADDAKTRWVEALGGPIRAPVILPNGTQVIPLAWSPSDAQMIEARKMSLIDVANLFNLDGYWLGAPTAGITYKTAGPMYQQVLRTSLEPVLADVEDVWSDAWLPRGTFIRFDRNQLLRDDLPTTATALATLVTAGIISPAQAQAYLGLPVIAGGGYARPENSDTPLQQTGGPDTGEPEDLEEGDPDE
jgi:HK97 family phage portal protein